MISSYIQEISSSIGFGAGGSTESRSSSKILVLETDIVRRPVPLVFTVVGYTDGFEVFHLQPAPVKVAALHTGEAVSIVKVLPARTGFPRNVAVVFKSSPTVVRFIDMSTSESYHVVRLTVPVIGIKASLNGIVVATDGRIHVLHSDSLEETMVLPCMPTSSAFALSDRWLAYNLNPQSGSDDRGRFPVMSQVWTRLSTMGQDALDNILLAVNSGRQGSGGTDATSQPAMAAEAAVDANPMTTMSALQSPVRLNRDLRNGIVAIRDAVSMKVIGCIEDSQNPGRVVECIEWSSCGTKLLTTSGNGHTVLVYSVKLSGGVSGRGNVVEFELTHSLNRGITPATITGLGIDGRIAAVCSSKGTVHIFDLEKANGGDRGIGMSSTSAIRIEGDASVAESKVSFLPGCVSSSASLCVVNRASLAVEIFTLSDLDNPSLVSTTPLPTTSPETAVEDLKLDLKPSATESGSGTKSTNVELKTCNDVAVPLWMSPQVAFFQRTAEGGRVKIEFKPEFGVTVEYSSEVDFAALTSAVDGALATPIVPGDKNGLKTGQQYFVSPKETIRDGFVQIVERQPEEENNH